MAIQETITAFYLGNDTFEDAEHARLSLIGSLVADVNETKQKLESGSQFTRGSTVWNDDIKQLTIITFFPNLDEQQKFSEIMLGLAIAPTSNTNQNWIMTNVKTDVVD